jgi:protein tyrosine/serine phosphatase
MSITDPAIPTGTDDSTPFDALFNFRDLGGHVTATGRHVRRGVVYRSDGMHRATLDDLGRIELLGITRVVDLRTTHERTEDGCFDDAHPSIEYSHIPIFERLSGVAGARVETVADDDEVPLLTTYRMMLTDKRDRLVTAIEAVAGAPGPVVFHCTAGKDRTGVVAALLLSTVGVSDEVIVDDYGRSRAAMARLVEWYRANRRDDTTGAGLTDARSSRLLGAEPEWMRVVLRELRAEHGSIRDYLLAAGATPALLAGIEAKLLDGD